MGETRRTRGSFSGFPSVNGRLIMLFPLKRFGPICGDRNDYSRDASDGSRVGGLATDNSSRYTVVLATHRRPREACRNHFQGSAEI